MGYSQNYFPLSFQREKLVRLAVIGLGWLFIGGQSIWSQQESSDFALRLRANVVKIEVPNRGNVENGFGFIVGQRAGQLYIVTAQHVIVPNDDPGVTAPARVKVTFYSDQGKTYDAEVLGTHDTAHDLAVLRLPVPNGFSWVKDALASQEMQKRGVHVWFIGRTSNWFVPVDPGVINSEHPSADWRLEIERLPVRPGSSGGPLVSSNGIVAMVQKGNEDDAFALTIDFIKTSMQDWNYPWDLLPVTGTAPAPGPQPATQPTQTKTTAKQPRPKQTPAEASCNFFVSSTPAAAIIQLDGQFQGITPSSVQLAAGRSYQLGLTYIGYNNYSSTVDCDTPGVNVSLSPLSSSAPAPTGASSITLRYTGDLAGCNLLLNVKIGNRSFNPSGSIFPVENVPLGNQRYSIQGTIACSLLGQCRATGAGQLNFVNGLTYDVVWRNTGIGQCTVGLQPALF
jgi:hypothetical protein